jgi:hypothetical protein
MKEWFPMAKEIEYVKELTPNLRFAYFWVEIAWPFAPRESYIAFHGINYPKENEIAIIFSNPLRDKWFDMPIKYDKDSVPLIYYKGILLLKRLPNDQCEFKAILNGDP